MNVSIWSKSGFWWRTHVKGVVEKLGVICRTASVKEAVHRGLVRLN